MNSQFEHFAYDNADAFLKRFWNDGWRLSNRKLNLVTLYENRVEFNVSTGRGDIYFHSAPIGEYIEWRNTMKLIIWMQNEK